MKKRLLISACFFGVFMALLVVMTLAADKTASKVRAGVLRFHVVANSDSDTDQQNKFAVRDGIAEFCAELFKDSPSKENSMELAVKNADRIEKKAENILKNRNCDMQVSAIVTKRFFPTRHYDGVSLPAGVYDTLDVKIGKAEGKNFWCVMFPSICIGASLQSNVQAMAQVLDDDAANLVTKKTPSVKFKFRLVEIFQSVCNLF